MAFQDPLYRLFDGMLPEEPMSHLCFWRGFGAALCHSYMVSLALTLRLIRVVTSEAQRVVSLSQKQQHQLALRRFVLC